jgi:polyhydroxyalkanoate synthase
MRKGKNYLSDPELLTDVIEANKKIIRSTTANLPGMLHDQRDLIVTYTNLAIKLLANPKEMFTIQKNILNYIQNQQRLFLHSMSNENDASLIAATKNDKRFNAAEWNEHPFDVIKQSYLLFSKMVNDTFAGLELDTQKRRKLNFYNKQFLDAISPSNFLLTNPEAIEKAIETNGESVINGYRNLLKDIKEGRISQTDDTTFHVGKNLAITKGAVVYRNNLVELIQYSPLTSEVHEVPLLIIPPWINKYYILDLQQKNSFVRYAVEQGFTVFIISWKNPTTEMGHIAFDDYVQKGILNSIEAIREITGSEKVNTMGYCIGGTLMGVALAVLAAKKQDVVNSAVFLAAMLDFSDIGPMGDVIEEALVRKMERGEILHNGIMSGRVMEEAFNLIRAKDLIWHYVVNNYLLGEEPLAFDVIQWTSDNSNLPADMYLYYIRRMVLENKLSKRNELSSCGVPINIHKIKVPALVIGMQEDHISPCKTVFITTELLKGPVDFLVGGSGHVIGVANPPAKNKYGYKMGGVLDEGFNEWLRTAQSYEGSWWTPWKNWLSERSEKLVPARIQLGSDKYPALVDAPGTYVFEQCCEME